MSVRVIVRVGAATLCDGGGRRGWIGRRDDVEWLFVLLSVRLQRSWRACLIHREIVIRYPESPTASGGNSTGIAARGPPAAEGTSRRPTRLHHPGADGRPVGNPTDRSPDRPAAGPATPEARGLFEPAPAAPGRAGSSVKRRSDRRRSPDRPGPAAERGARHWSARRTRTLHAPTPQRLFSVSFGPSD